MLSDRPYMRDVTPEQRFRAGVWLISAVLAGFVLQEVFSRWFGAQNLFERELGLSAIGFREGRFWTLITHGFLHDDKWLNLLHVISTVVGLYFLSRALFPLLGARRFLGVYFTALIAGGMVWLATHWQTGGTLVGATSAIDALLIVYCCFFPNQEVTFLVLFYPVTLKPKYLAYGMVTFDLVGFILYERLGWHSPIDIAFSAHLGGMLVGWSYYRFIHDTDWTIRRPVRAPAMATATATRRNARATVEERSPAEEKLHLKAEVDRILDKINSKGLNSLTSDEKRILARAKEQMNRR